MYSSLHSGSKWTFGSEKKVAVFIVVGDEEVVVADAVSEE